MSKKVDTTGDQQTNIQYTGYTYTHTNLMSQLENLRVSHLIHNVSIYVYEIYNYTYIYKSPNMAYIYIY